MAELTVQTISTSGLEAATPTAVAAGGDYFTNNGRTFFRITDGATTAPTVTVASQVECSQGSTHDLTVAVPSGETRYVGPFPTDRFNDDDGYVQLTYDDDTSVTIEVFTI